jgi:hypothetical protein
VISLHHHIKHHDPHTEEIPREAEASDGEGSEIAKELQRVLSNVEKGMIIVFFVIDSVISTVSLLVCRP